jgi:hypothetical protein
MSKLPGEIIEMFHGAGKYQIKSKCLNDKTYTATCLLNPGAMAGIKIV